jgi:para-nitrobenzyl esterase
MSPAPVVHTTDGDVRGISGFDTQQFLGIPFAQPPIGALRFAAPVPAVPWTGVRDATHLALPCAAEISGDGPRSTNEDCLYLNVYRPSDATPGAALPVMVFVHGGGNFSGSTRIYDGVRMAEVGHAVVVIAAYRLGVFGSLALPSLGAAAGTQMLRDHLAALQWVHDNIAAFGGSPADVTVSGESSGGTDVCTLLAAPAAAGLFRQAIVQSGLCSGGPFGGPTLAVARAAATTLAHTLRCDHGDVADCLRALPAGEVLDAWHGPNGTASGTTLAPESLTDAFAHGHINPVPLLIGFNRDEWWGFELALYPLSDAGYRHAAATQFGDRAAAALTLYPAANYPHREYAFGAAVGDAMIICPALTVARTLSAFTHVSVYEFADRTAPPWHSLGFAQTVPPGYGGEAGHTAELDYLLNYAAAGRPLDAMQRRLGDAMIQWWVGFNRATPPQWPAFTAAEPMVTRFGADGASIDATTTLGAEHHCDLWR